MEGLMLRKGRLGFQPRAIWVITRLTVRETARRKLLLALLVLTVVIIAVTLYGISRLSTIGGEGQRLTPLEIKTVTSQILILVPVRDAET